MDGTDFHTLDAEAAALLALERRGSDHESDVDDGEKEGCDPIARNGQRHNGHDDLSGDDEVAGEMEAQEVRALRPGEAGAGGRPDLRSRRPQEDPGCSSDGQCDEWAIHEGPPWG